jgi:hypothetical protein
VPQLQIRRCSVAAPDLTLALNAARKDGLSVPMRSIAASLYQMLGSRGLGDVDASALHQADYWDRRPTGRSIPTSRLKRNPEGFPGGAY